MTPLDIARTQLGVTEWPPGSNLCVYGEYTGYNGQPWCGSFIAWCYAQAGLPLDGPIVDCDSYYGWAVDRGLHVAEPQPGDIVLFTWGVSPWRADHVGLLEAANADGTITTIEGNTSLASDDNGGCVMRRVRDREQVSLWCRPYPTKPTGDDDMTDEERASLNEIRDNLRMVRMGMFVANPDAPQDQWTNLRLGAALASHSAAPLADVTAIPTPALLAELGRRLG